MAEEIVDPLEPQLADFERQLADLEGDLKAATTRRERAGIRRTMRQIHRRALLTRLRRNPAIRW